MIVILEMLLYIIGGIMSLVGWIMMIVFGFQKNAGWGVGTIFFPIVGVVNGLMNWEQCKKQMIVWFVGIALTIIAVVGFAATAVADGALEGMKQQEQAQQQIGNGVSD